MPIEFYDKTGEPRSDKELQEAIVALKNAFILTKLDPIMIHYPVIWDSLYELLSYRKIITELKIRGEGSTLSCPRCTYNMGKVEPPYKSKCPSCGHGWQSWTPITS